MIELHNVSRHFRSTTAVDGVSLEIRKGEVFALLGPNGAGKTTTIRMLLGLTEPDSGEIRYRDIPLHAGRPAARHVGYLPEDRGLYPDASVSRVIEHMAVLRGVDRRDARAAAARWLTRLDLADRARDAVKALSKGNQQKVQFITAALHDPLIAVLDEPFSGLDPLNQDTFLTLIDAMRADGRTVVLSAHQMNLVERIADRVVVLKRGRVVLQGSLSELRRQRTDATRLTIRVTGEPSLDFLQEGPFAIESNRDGELKLRVSQGIELSRALTLLAHHLDIVSIESTPITLHDLYIEAVREPGEA